MTQHLSPEQIRANARYAEHRNLTRQAIPDRDGADSAAMYAAERLKHGLALAGIAQPATRCSTEGHEYNFGVCLDCEQVDPAFEPTDDMIERDYLRGYDRPAAA